MKAKTSKLYPHTALLLLRDEEFLDDMIYNKDKYLDNFATHEEITINPNGKCKNMNIKSQLEEFKKKLKECKGVKNIKLVIDTHEITKNVRHVGINHYILEKVLDFLADQPYNIHIQLYTCDNTTKVITKHYRKNNIVYPLKIEEITNIIKKRLCKHKHKVIYSTMSDNGQFLEVEYNQKGIEQFKLYRDIEKKNQNFYRTDKLLKNFILDKATNTFYPTRPITPNEQDVAIWYRQPKKTVNNKPVLEKTRTKPRAQLT